VTRPGVPPPEGPIAVESRPLDAARVFGSELPTAERYVGLLAGPGVTRGLVGPHEAARLWTRHVLNSAALADLVPPDVEVVDLGSGAGLPGIPLHLARPDLRMTLLEPMARRVAFLAEVVAVLGIDVHVTRGRAEELTRASADVIVARAVAPLSKLVAMALPVLRPGGLLLALKGEGAATEIEAAESVLKRWPLATVTLATVPTGTEPATVVKVALDGGESTGRGS
jgi:16S rRNA (guanine527-N7)-methyltransferase